MGLKLTKKIKNIGKTCWDLIIKESMGVSWLYDLSDNDHALSKTHLATMSIEVKYVVLCFKFPSSFKHPSPLTGGIFEMKVKYGYTISVAMVAFPAS